MNFYAQDTVNPYVALAARGPWIITTKGAVIHDSGGYGMLGHGHAPEKVLAAMSKPHVMANVMTPSLSQMQIVDALREEIGHTRENGCDYESFVFMNSGSEAACCKACPHSCAATVIAVGSPLATSPAKVGPETTASPW